MRHLVKIFSECEKIANLKKKIIVDPRNTKRYEVQMWKHYANVTEYNEQYVEEKGSTVPEIKNAYLTFRSMEGKERALKAFGLNWCQRVCTFGCWQKH